MMMEGLETTIVGNVVKLVTLLGSFPRNTPKGNQPKPNPVAANAEINIPWTLPIRQNLMTDMMKRAINSEVVRRTAPAKYKKLRNKVQQITSASSTPISIRQKSSAIKTTPTNSYTSSTLSARTASASSKAITKTPKATTTVPPSVPKMVVKTESVTTTKTTNNKSKATTSYTGPITRAKAKKQAQVQLLETIPENLLSESDDEDYSLLEDLQATLADDDSENEEVNMDLPDSDEDIEEKLPTMGYKPETYFTSVEKDDIPLWKHIKGYVTVVSVGTTTDASVPIQVGKSKCTALIDTGATKSVIRESYYRDLMLPSPKKVYNIDVRSASGNRLKPMGITECTFSLGNQPYTYDFFVCKDLSRPTILGLDFLRANRIGTDWSNNGKFILHQKNTVLVESLETYITGPRIYTKNHIDIPGRTLAVLNVTVDVRKEHWNKDFHVKANRLLINEYLNLIAIPTIHIVGNAQNPVIPYVLVNLSTDQVYLPKRKLLGQLISTDDEKEDIFPETVYADICNINDISDLDQDNIEVEKKFITSPADGEVHRKVELKDAVISDEHKQQFAELCKEYDDIFSRFC